jgi:hypothetical protein
MKLNALATLIINNKKNGVLCCDKLKDFQPIVEKLSDLILELSHPYREETEGEKNVLTVLGILYGSLIGPDKSDLKFLADIVGMANKTMLEHALKRIVLNNIMEQSKKIKEN